MADGNETTDNAVDRLITENVNSLVEKFFTDGIPDLFKHREEMLVNGVIDQQKFLLKLGEQFEAQRRAAEIMAKHAARTGNPGAQVLFQTWATKFDNVRNAALSPAFATLDARMTEMNLHLGSGVTQEFHIYGGKTSIGRLLPAMANAWDIYQIFDALQRGDEKKFYENLGSFIGGIVGGAFAAAVLVGGGWIPAAIVGAASLIGSYTGEKIAGGAYDMIVSGVDPFQPNIQHGSAGNDQLVPLPPVQEPGAPPPPPAPYLIFAGNGDDIVFGSDSDDVLDGGDGADKIEGEGGGDFLHGGIGDDTLDGGRGSDTLEDEGGFETYRFYTDDFADGGSDRIQDADGQGVILFNDVPVQGVGLSPPYYTDGTWLSSDEKFRFIVTGAVGAQTLHIVYRDTNARIVVENWQNGQFGIELNTPPGTMPPPQTGWEGHNGWNILFLPGVEGGTQTIAATDGSDWIRMTATEVDLVDRADDAEWVQDTLSTWGVAVIDWGDNWVLRTADGRPYNPLDHLGEADVTIDYRNPTGSTNFEVVDSDDHIYAGAGDDLVEAGRGDDTVEGGVGDDELNGNSGHDLLDGGTGDDLLDGWSGRDTLVGGSGDDTLNGNEDDDVLAGGDGVDHLFGHDGADALTGGELGDTLVGGIGDDTLEGDDGDDHLQGDAGRDVLIGGLGADSLLGLEDDDALRGDAGNDTMLGHAGDDTLDGGADADLMSGGAGDDSLAGGDGNDQLQGGHELEANELGADTLDGGAGNDLMIGHGGADELEGGDGNDELQGDGTSAAVGAHGADFLDGGAGDDTLFGDGGADVMLGGAGNDALWGDGGSDQNGIEAAHHGDDLLDGGAGNDTVSGHSGADLVLGGSGDDFVDGGLGDDLVDGGDGNDWVQDGIGDTGADELLGGFGNDTVIGEGGNDSVDGGDGDDRAQGGTGNDTVLGGAGIDTLWGMDGDDVLDGGVGNDLGYGGIGNDSLLGGEGNDTLYGEAGNDTLAGGAGTGSDYLDGGAGTNTYRWGLGQGSDTILGGSGSVDSVLELDASLTPATLRFRTFNNDLILSGSGDPYQLVIRSFGSTQNPVQSVRFADGTVWTLAQLVAAAFTGTWQSDAISGMATDDVLDGAGGDDSLYGAAGNDRVLGGTGHDLLRGDAGNDTLLGGDGVDRLYGGDGNDVLDGGAGSDLLDGGAGTDLFLVGLGAGNDTIEGDSADTLRIVGTLDPALVALGRSGLDLVLALPGNQQLRLQGYFGSKALAGIQFGEGGPVWTAADVAARMGPPTTADTLTGGAGNDLHLVDNASDVVVEAAGGGIDTVRASVEYTLGANVENLELTGSFGWSATGNALDNQITGNSGNNVIDGGAGIDTGAGGLGDDSYRNVETIVELADGGYDTQYVTTGTGGMAANVERMIVNSSTSPLNGSSYWGNDIDNLIEVNSTYFGVTINGGLGNDHIIYRGVQEVTIVLENEGDTWEVTSSATTNLHVRFGGTFVLDSRVRRFTADLGAVVDVTGNQFANRFEFGDAGAGSRLAGGAGNDEYVIGDGMTVVEAADEGYDRVYYSTFMGHFTLGDNLESLTLTDGAYHGTGNALANQLVGNTQDNVLRGEGGDDLISGGYGNDTLYGGSGADTMNGGTGFDTFYVDHLGDVIQEEGWEGGTAYVSVDGWNAGANRISVVHLIDDARDFTGSSSYVHGNEHANVIVANFSDAVYGYGGDDHLTGNYSLIGGDGDDTLVGIGPATIMEGGAGDDVGIGADNQWERFYGGDGNDLAMMGGGDDVIDGDAGNDTLDGGAGIDQLNGGDGNDGLSGGGDQDNLYGGAGADTLAGDDGDDYLAGGSDGDLLDGGVGTDFLLGEDGDDTLAGSDGDDLNGGNGDDLYLHGGGALRISDGQGNDRLRLAAGVAAGGTTLVNDPENGWQLRFGADAITLGFGSPSIDIVEFADGTVWDLAAMTNVAPTIWNDQPWELQESGAIVVNALDSIGDEDLASCTIQVLGGMPAWMTFDAQTRTFGGTAPANSGAAFNVQIRVTDRYGAATTGAIAFQVINTIRGTAGNDNLVGTTARDILVGLAGNDSLNGGAGGDWLIGGSGNDTYTIDHADDFADEFTLAGDDAGGLDSVLVSVNDHEMHQYVETLTLAGTAGLRAFGNDGDNTMNGNTGANRLEGGWGNDTLDGKAGSDTLLGGVGDDVYYVADSGDVVTELEDEGTDTIRSSRTLTLGANVENLELTGTTALNGTGNTLDNRLTGNSAANNLSGSSGYDTLVGGAGNDTLGGGNEDDVLDGGAGTDSLTGGSGHDEYVMGRGYGTDTAVENGSAGSNQDVARFLAGVAYDQLWFKRPSGSTNLEISILGTTDKLVIKGWFSGNNYHVEQIRTTDGSWVLDHADVQQLVTAMAAMTMPTGTTLTTAQRNQLAATFADTWYQETAANLAAATTAATTTKHPGGDTTTPGFVDTTADASPAVADAIGTPTTPTPVIGSPVIGTPTAPATPGTLPATPATGPSSGTTLPDPASTADAAAPTLQHLTGSAPRLRGGDEPRQRVRTPALAPATAKPQDRATTPGMREEIGSNPQGDDKPHDDARTPGFREALVVDKPRADDTRTPGFVEPVATSVPHLEYERLVAAMAGFGLAEPSASPFDDGFAPRTPMLVPPAT